MTPAIRYGLSAVRNVGEGAVAKIIDARRAGGAFTSFSDFCRKVEPGVLTKRVLESLVQAGAFDSLGYTRQGLLQAHDKVSAPILAERKAEAAGQFSLFGGAVDDGDVDDTHAIDESVLEAEEFDKRELLRREKEMLGQFVTDHPLLEVREALAARARTRSSISTRSTTATSSRSAASSARSGASTPSVESPTRSSDSKALRAGSAWSRSRASTRPCRA